ncbi:hypothetical protein BS47DRAFT_1293122, partial [Hydnum rufescens UP504]
QLSFGSLYASKRVIVVFIRDDSMAMDLQAYVTELAKVRKEALDAANTDLVIVGCGDPSMLKQYREDVGFQGAGYADPSRAIYFHLGMTAPAISRTPKGGNPPSYVPRNRTMTIIKSTWVRCTSFPLSIISGKSGDITQNGGEFIFGPGQCAQCEYASRMKHTEDHIDVPDLMGFAGVEFP